MANKTGEILTLLAVGLALGFWLIAMTTHGWFIVAYDFSSVQFDFSVCISDLWMIYMDALIKIILTFNYLNMWWLSLL